MQINVSMTFNNIDDLLEFYERLRQDNPVDYVEKTGFTKEQIDTAITEADFASLVTPKTQGKEEPAPVEEKKPTSVHSRDEVKAFCTQSRVEKGVKIKDVLLTFGVENFKALPDDKLDALYDAVKAARGD